MLGNHGAGADVLVGPQREGRPADDGFFCRGGQRSSRSLLLGSVVFDWLTGNLDTRGGASMVETSSS